MTGKQIRFKNRESWLYFVTEQLRPKFAEIDFPLPEKIRVAIGFTSKGKSKKTIGQCWDKAASSDGHYEIFIVPWLKSRSGNSIELDVASVLCHELIHCSQPCFQDGHKGSFKIMSKALGLMGPSTATVAGPLFCQLIGPILEEAGPFPHGILNMEAVVRVRKDPDEDGDEDGEEGDDEDGYTIIPLTDTAPTQTNRYIKCECHCGYIARVARKWLTEAGAPHCPNHGEMTPDAVALAKLHEAEDIRNAKKAKRREEKPYRDPGTRNSKKQIAPEELPDTGPLVINPLTPSIAERESWRSSGGDVVRQPIADPEPEYLSEPPKRKGGRWCRHNEVDDAEIWVFRPDPSKAEIRAAEEIGEHPDEDFDWDSAERCYIKDGKIVDESEVYVGYSRWD